LIQQADEVMRALAGLIGVVEGEAGSVSKFIAKVSSVVVINLGLVLKG